VTARRLAEPDTPGYSIRAVLRVCDILNYLQVRPGGATLQEIAEKSRLPKSSAFRYLATLQSRRYVERDTASGLFRLGIAFLSSRPQQIEILAARIHPLLAQLAADVGETVALGVLDSTQVTYVDAIESPRAVRLTARQGDRVPVHSTAVGKAISARLPDDRVRAVLRAEGMPRLTSRTITDVESFVAKLPDVRQRGYAVDDGESEVDGRSVAVPVAGTDLPVAIAVSAPQSRLPLDRMGELAHRLGAIAQQARSSDPAPGGAADGRR
jgi:IclR family transcriptional regulator, acetate operon repressor